MSSVEAPWPYGEDSRRAVGLAPVLGEAVARLMRRIVVRPGTSMPVTRLFLTVEAACGVLDSVGRLKAMVDRVVAARGSRHGSGKVEVRAGGDAAGGEEGA